jgi:tRNA dimethylallyltransferase
VTPGAPPLFVIGGATATGKTGLAIRVAQSLSDEGVTAEVISADSRQVYRGLDVGTAKPTIAERKGVPHHGLDLVDLDVRFSLADYVAHAGDALRGIAGRSGLAILAGGTGLYIRGVAHGIATDALPSDRALRAEIEDQLANHGLPALAARLEVLAPTSAARVDLGNPRRVVRALELAELRGDAGLPKPRGYPGPVAWLGLALDAPTHRAWIETRARAQFDAGLIEEAETLRQRYDPTLPAFSAIGYREAWAFLDGRLTRDEAIVEDVRRNVAYARRQRTWFRAEPAIEWLDATDPALTERAIARARALVDAGD